jgi:hypothetical protein
LNYFLYTRNGDVQLVFYKFDFIDATTQFKLNGGETREQIIMAKLATLGVKTTSPAGGKRSVDSSNSKGSIASYNHTAEILLSHRENTDLRDVSFDEHA